MGKAPGPAPWRRSESSNAPFDLFGCRATIGLPFNSVFELLRVGVLLEFPYFPPRYGPDMRELGAYPLARGFIHASVDAERDDLVSGVQQCLRNYRKSFPLHRYARERAFNNGLLRAY